jgi:hypothetical protein
MALEAKPTFRPTDVLRLTGRGLHGLIKGRVDRASALI